MNLLVRVLYVLLAIAVVILCYYVIIWVLGLLGIRVPENILTVVFVILGLLAAIGALSGRLDNIWGPRA
jgi:bacteriorhodopsin